MYQLLEIIQSIQIDWFEFEPGKRNALTIVVEGQLEETAELAFEFD